MMVHTRVHPTPSVTLVLSFHPSYNTLPCETPMPFTFRFPIALVLSIACLAVPAWADFQAGMDAYKRKDYATALREWGPLARQGHADAQFMLGDMYRYGEGVPRDYVQGQKWYEKAAAQGNAKAQYELGQLYQYGYAEGVDYKQARQWYEKAAVQGIANAQYLLGVLYEEGAGVPQNYKQARRWYEQAAAQDHPKAQLNLGTMYELGFGVTQDYVQAHMWYNLAGANGNYHAAPRRDALAKKMTPAQIDEADKLAREWTPTTP